MPVSLLVIPAAVFLGPAAFGHLLAPGDDVTQNLPLRILVGQDIRAGHLPLWDPYIWSGSPLLGGFNAGALHPFTLLFAALPFGAAWAVGQWLTYGLGALGLYLFGRRHGFGRAPAWLGSVAFTWSGFMWAQLAHVGLTEGMAGVGWVLLGLDHLSRPEPDRRGDGLLWSGLTGLVIGMVALAGDPRGLSNVAIAAAVFGAWALWRRPPGRARLLLGGLGAALVGAAVSMGQLLPGLAAQSGSQRAAASLVAFAAGSLWPAWLLLIPFPFLLGGFGSLHLPLYRGSYNLAEISGSVGLLTAAGALSAVAGRLAGIRRRDAPARAGPGSGPWVLLLVAGVVLALGDHTPLVRVLVHVPLYNLQRLQSRNLGLVDLAVVLLFGHWMTAWVGRPPRGPGPGPWATAAGLLAPAAVFTGLAVALAWPGGLSHWMGRRVDDPTILPGTWPYALAAGLMAGAVVVVLVVGRRWPRRARLAVATALVLLDTGFYAANGAVGWVSTSAVSALADHSSLAPRLAPGSRYAVVDPDLFYPAYRTAQPGLVPVPDLNALAGLASIQGYGSLVADAYEQATGTHTQASLDAADVAAPLAARLRLDLVLVDPADPLAATPALTRALARSGWSPAGRMGGLTAWRNPHPGPPAYLSGPGRVSCGPVDPADGALACRAQVRGPVSLVRSEAFAPGWKADLVGPDHHPRPVAVKPRDLLQSVALPGPGAWTVRFRYLPRRDYLAVAVSALGALAGLGLVGLGLAGISPRRARRAARPPRSVGDPRAG